MRWKTAHARRQRRDRRDAQFAIVFDMTCSMIVYAALDDLLGNVFGRPIGERCEALVGIGGTIEPGAFATGGRVNFDPDYVHAAAALVMTRR